MRHILRRPEMKYEYLKEIDDETEEYVGVENEFVLETVFALFKERNKDFFTFE